MFDAAKFKALVHYVIARVEDPSQLGAVKLNKILWFIDGQAYLRTGKTLTGARYIKEPQGPVAKAMLPLLRELQSEGAIRIESVDYYGRGKWQYRSLRDARTNLFSKEERDYIDEITAIIALHHTAKSISEATHGPAWKLARNGEDLPFHAVLAEDLQPVTKEDIAWAKERMSAYEAAVA